MAKRFTDTDKWSKKWFRKLSPEFKLAWLYLCDKCDLAGTINLDEELAAFQIGTSIDWDKFIEASNGRAERLPNGRWWLPAFIPFQHPRGLSTDCNAQQHVLGLIDANGLRDRLCDWLAYCTSTVDEGYPNTPGKGNGNGPGRGRRKGGAGGKPVNAADVSLPDGFESEAVRGALAEWLAYKTKRGEAYRDAAYLGRKVAEFGSPAAFVSAVHSSIGNNYSGIFAPRIQNGPKPTTRSKRFQG